MHRVHNATYVFQQPDSIWFLWFYACGSAGSVGVELPEIDTMLRRCNGYIYSYPLLSVCYNSSRFYTRIRVEPHGIVRFYAVPGNRKKLCGTGYPVIHMYVSLFNSSKRNTKIQYPYNNGKDDPVWKDYNRTHSFDYDSMIQHLFAIVI